MEKLIELLNEYENQLDLKGCTRSEQLNFIGHIKAVSEYSDNILYNADLAVTSKRYGFIKRLVENEKIEGEKFQEPKIRGIIGLISNWHNSEGKSYKDYSKELAYESLLMLLSIQDEPIEFLVSILK